jgi:membrane protease YdiL (CAAX protease family)
MIENARGGWVEIEQGRQRFVPWSAGDAVRGILLLAAGAVIIIGGLALAQRGDGGPVNGTLVSAVIVLPHLMMLVAAWLFGVRKYGTTWTSVGLGRPRHRLSMLLPWPVLIGSIGFGGVYVVVITAIGMDSLLPSSLPPDLLGEGAHKLFNIAVIGVVGPLVEELFFRGFLLAALVRPLGPGRAAAVASVIFSAGHINIGVMLPFFVSGLLLSWLYLRTRSIWPGFMAHSAQNLLALSFAV